MFNKLISRQNLPISIIWTGKAIKKQLRKIKRSVLFGTKNYTKEIALPETSFQLIINPYKNACVDEIIADRGNWEPEITSQLAKYIQPGNTFVDIGANIGYHSMFIASLLKNTGQVYALEPVDSLATQIEQSIAINNFTNVRLFRYGLGDKNQAADIHLRDENMGGTSIFSHRNLNNIVKISGTEKIEIKRLDDLVSDTTKIDLIKIDVEGYEYEALRGAERILRESQPVIFMEFSPVFYQQDYPEKAEDLIIFLKELGYAFENMDGSPIDLGNWLKKTENPYQIDIIAIPTKK